MVDTVLLPFTKVEKNKIIYEAGGRYSVNQELPVLACSGCRRIIRPAPGQVQIVCKCGRLYRLMAEGRPVRIVL
jgi:hypothetical protein